MSFEYEADLPLLDNFDQVKEKIIEEIIRYGFFLFSSKNEKYFFSTKEILDQNSSNYDDITVLFKKDKVQIIFLNLNTKIQEELLSSICLILKKSDISIEFIEL